MAVCILNSMKRFASPLNYILLQSKCLSQASFAIAGEPKPMSVIHDAASNINHKKLPLKKALEYENVVNSVKLQKNAIVYAQDNSRGSNTSGSCNPDQCSPEQLSIVFENLRKYVPQFFVTVMDYTIYHPQLIFENNIQGKRTVGLAPFIVKLAITRAIGHLKYSYVEMEVMKMTKHPEDSTVKIRWRMSGITGFQIAAQMWKYKIWKPTEMIHSTKRVWIDGFSTMYVGSDGKIFKHVADRMMPDQDFERNEKSRILSPLEGVPKMAIFVGLSPDLSSVIFALN